MSTLALEAGHSYISVGAMTNVPAKSFVGDIIHDTTLLTLEHFLLVLVGATNVPSYNIESYNIEGLCYETVSTS